MINVGEKQVEDIFVGDMGIKEVIVGNETVHKRDGGYFYLKLESEEE